MNQFDELSAAHAVRRMQDRLYGHRAKSERTKIARIMERGRNVAIGFRRFLTPSH